MGDFSNTALTGLNAASYELSMDSSNIANVNTLGYKSQSANFYELYSSNAGGGGVMAGDVNYNFGQGTAIQTGGKTDMMINGNGFFILRDAGSGQTYYTRAGAFHLDDSGYLINPQGYRVQAYSGVSTSGALADLQVSQAPLAPSASTTVSFVGNLQNASSTPVTNTVTFYDQKGSQHTLGITFTYNADLAGTPPAPKWDVTYKMDGATISGTSDSMTFGASGALSGGGSYSLTLPNSMGSLTIDRSAMTSYGSGSNLAGPTGTANGYAAGSYTGVLIEKGGAVVANYSNGQTQQIGSMALASFTVNGGLQNAGNGNWLAGSGVGAVTTGVSGSSNLGSILTGQLEGSNVDLSSEVVDMISAQRDFQSDAQVLKTGKILDQTVLSINQ